MRSRRRACTCSLINYSYDALDRLTVKDVPVGAYREFDVTYTYDLLGRLVQATDAEGFYVTRSYDALGRMLTDHNVFYGKYLAYDLAGRLTRIAWPGGDAVDYDYLVTGEMSRVRENGATSGVGVLATYGYDALGRRTSLTRGNGTVTSWSYDGVSRLASLGHDLSGGAHDVTTTFGYNPAGQLAASSRSNDGYAWAGHYNVDRAYNVNGLNQLTTAGATALGYDGRGNLTSSGSTSYAYDMSKRVSC